MNFPVVARDLLTVPEDYFFEELKKAYPDINIFVQVAVSRLIQVEKGYDSEYWFNRFSRLSVDYVLCGNNSNKPLVAIELDDDSHKRPDRMKTDEKKDNLFKSAGIPLVRFNLNKMPNHHQIRFWLQNYIK